MKKIVRTQPWLIALLVILSACMPLARVQPQAVVTATGNNTVPVAVVSTSRSAAATATAQPASASASQALSSEETQFVELYKRVSPAVVYIETEAGSGSGFVVDTQGHIVTNNHVIDGAQRIEVVFSDGTRVAGTVIGRDADADVAVLKVDVPAGQLVPVELGDSASVQVGQIAIAIGNPFGLQNTMTTGIVSGLGRTLQSDRAATAGQGSYTNPNVIQTDAAINPGNSGGPLFDAEGRVIGINAAIASDNATVTGQASNSGVGFAIPINTVKRILPSLIEKGSYTYPYLGMSGLDELTLNTAKQLGLSQTTGVYVTTVVPGGPADQAGVRAGTGLRSGVVGPGGDLIVGIDDQKVTDFAGLIGYLVSEKSPGDQVVLHVLRDGQSLDLAVTLGERP